MLALSSPSEKAIRAQVADAVSLIAELDFPVKWPTLIDVSDTFLSFVAFP
jgi:exportin-2 (importin alpha re-exporter)